MSSTLSSSLIVRSWARQEAWQGRAAELPAGLGAGPPAAAWLELRQQFADAADYPAAPPASPTKPFSVDPSFVSAGQQVFEFVRMMAHNEVYLRCAQLANASRVLGNLGDDILSKITLKSGVGTIVETGSDDGRFMALRGDLLPAACGSWLLQRHRPDGAEPQAAPDEIRQLGGHGANWFELIAFYRKIIKYSVGQTSASFFSVAFCPGFYRVTHSESVALPCRFSAIRSSLEASSSSLRAFSSRSKAAGCALGSQQDRQPLSDLLADELLLHLLGQRCDLVRANAALPQGLALLAERLHRALLPASAMAGAALRAARWFKRLPKLKLQVLRPLHSASPSSSGCRPPPPGPVGYQPLQHGRSPSELVVQAAHLLQRGSPLQHGPQLRTNYSGHS